MSGDGELVDNFNDPDSINVQGPSGYIAAVARKDVPTRNRLDNSRDMEDNNGAVLAPSEPVVPGRSGSSTSPVSVSSAMSSTLHPSEFRQVADALNAAANEMKGDPSVETFLSAIVPETPDIDMTLHKFEVPPSGIPMSGPPALNVDSPF